VDGVEEFDEPDPSLSFGSPITSRLAKRSEVEMSWAVPPAGVEVVCGWFKLITLAIAEDAMSIGEVVKGDEAELLELAADIDAGDVDRLVDEDRAAEAGAVTVTNAVLNIVVDG